MRLRRSTAPRPPPRQRPLLEELEPRILFSADAAAGLLDANQLDVPAQVRLLEPAPVAPELLAGAEAVQQTRHEIVFVDTRVADYQVLLDDLLGQNNDSRQIEVFVLDPNQNGIEQISQVLAQRHDIDALHLISHGADGEVQLGDTYLNFDSLRNQAAQIQRWGDALTADADLLIYGCDVAQQADGKALVDALSRLTGADVAASTDLTGSAALGGDWILEYRVGTIETAGAVMAAAQQSWAGTLAAVGGTEFQVNTTTANDQTTDALNRGSQQAVAYDDAGNFVVVWTSKTQDGSGDGVYARRFDAAGTALTNEILINATTAGDQNSARVASDAAGNFVVTWTSDGQDGNQTGVYARRFDSNGNALTGEIAVNTSTAGPQRNSVIGMNRSTGEFVIVWEGQGIGDTQGIFYRRYAADGSANDGGERRANVTASVDEANPAVAMDSSGNFVIAFDANNHMYFQRFNSSGAAQGNAVQVDTLASHSTGAAIAMDGAGNFTVVYRETTVSSGVWGRGYNADGSERYSWFKVDSALVANTNAASPSIAMAADGTFIVTYQKSGDGLDIFAQRYKANGTTSGSLFQVNQYTLVDQKAPSIALRDIDNFVVVWSGKSAADSVGVSARVWAPPNTAPVITSDGGNSSASLTAAENTTAVTTVTATDTDLPAQTLTYSIVGGADQALFSIDAGTGVLVFATAPDYELPSDANADNIYHVTVQVSDGKGGTDTQAIAVSVTPSNDNAPLITSFGGAPTASVSVSENSVAVGVITATDTDQPAQSLTYAIVGGVDQGLFEIDASSGALSFRIVPDFEAPADDGGNNVYEVRVGVSDGGLTDEQSLTITVTDQNESAVGSVSDSDASSNQISENAGNNSPVGITAHAIDPDIGDTVTYSLEGDAGGRFKIDADTGVVTVADGSLLDYESATSYAITVRATSIDTSVSFANFSISVLPVEDNAPVITSNGGGATALVSMPENAVAVTTITATDADRPGDVLSYSISGGTDAALFTIDAASGALSFLAAPNREVPTDANVDNVYELTVEVSDGHGATASQAISVLVENVNEAPAAADDNASGNEDTTITSNVLANDTDVDGNPLNAVLVSGTAHGTLSLNADGSYSYTPYADWNGTDSFTYIANDGSADSNVATVSLTVSAVNDAPTTTAVALAPITEDSGSRIITQAELLTNAADVDGPSVSATTLAIASGFGALVNNGDGTWSYTPAGNDASAVSFTYAVTDGSLSSVGTATLDITPVNDAPQGASTTVTTQEDTAYVFNSSDFGFSDPADSPANSLLNVKISSLPAIGALTDNGVSVSAGQVISVADISGGKLVFVPASGGSGAAYASFSFQVQDDGGTVNAGTDMDQTARMLTIDVSPAAAAAASPSGPAAAGGDLAAGGALDNGGANGEVPPEAIATVITEPTQPGAPVPAANDADAGSDTPARTSTVAQDPFVAPAPGTADFVPERAPGNAVGAAASAEPNSARHGTNAGAARIAAVPEWMAAQFPQFAELGGAPAADFSPLAALSPLGTGSAPKTETLVRDLDELRKTVKEGGGIEKYTLSSAVAVSTGLSVGYAAWLVRGGVLLSTLLSSMPAWRVLDPFPVLARQRDRDEDDDDDSLESMVDDDGSADEPIVSDESSDHGGAGDHSNHGAREPAPRS